MEINLINAVKQFFPNPSLEMVYFEAIANSIDANATEIQINVSINSFTEGNTLTVEIIDNGEGFNDTNFRKFSKLLETEELGHKGLGRLVFLNYFKDVIVESHFENKKRVFNFNESFDGKNSLEDSFDGQRGTKMKFSKYYKKTIKTYDYIRASSIRKALELHFFPIFHSFNINKRDLKVIISVSTNEPSPENDFYTEIQTLSILELPKLEEVKFYARQLHLYDEFTLYYNIIQNNEETSIITAICAEGRTIKFDIVTKENLPIGYEFKFLLYSKYFDGKVNSSRQKLDVEENIDRDIKSVLTEKMAEILDEKIPSIKEKNNHVRISLNNRYPHLQGYFNDNSIGLIDRNKTLDIAQKKFFHAQKEILDATDLTEATYNKSLEVSARLLTEYILYRNIIINKLKTIDISHSETEIHNIIVPTKKIFKKDNFIKDIYSNNVWLLDDKYMSYRTILSELEMSKLLKELEINGENSEKDETRPDISLIFSNDPHSTENSGSKVDVVIVELKKLGLKLAKREEVISQLKQRARKLLNFFPNKIQRIWFYGIVDIDKEFRISLKEDGYTELYSKGELFYNEEKIIIDEEKDIKIPIGVYIMSFDAFLEDAETRNSTFLEILKEGLKRKVQDESINKSNGLSFELINSIN